MVDGSPWREQRVPLCNPTTRRQLSRTSRTSRTRRCDRRRILDPCAPTVFFGLGVQKPPVRGPNTIPAAWSLVGASLVSRLSSLDVPLVAYHIRTTWYGGRPAAEDSTTSQPLYYDCVPYYVITCAGAAAPSIALPILCAGAHMVRAAGLAAPAAGPKNEQRATQKRRIPAPAWQA